MVSSATITNLVTDVTLEFNQEDADYLIADDGFQVGDLESDVSTYSIHDRIGEKVESIQVSSGRDISITGWIIDDPIASMETKKSKLSSFFNPLQKLRLTSKGRYIDCYAKGVVEFGSKYKDNNELTCKFQVNLFCPYPLFTGEKIMFGYATTDNMIPYPHTALDFDSTNGLLGLFENPGDVPTGFSLEVYLNTSTLTSIRITNLALSEDNYFSIKNSERLTSRFRLDTNVESDSYGFYTRVGTETKETLDLSGMDFTSSFFSLATGTNRIKLSSLTGGVWTPLSSGQITQAIIRFSPKYFSLKEQ